MLNNRTTTKTHIRNDLISYLLYRFKIFVRHIKSIKINNKTDNIDHVATLTSNINHVSFDFFDTLVFRNVGRTKIAKLKSAEYAAIELSRLGCQLSRDDFYEARCRFEEALRQEYVNQGYDRECSLTEIITEVIKYFSNNVVEKYHDKLINKTVNFEVNYEIDTLFLHEQAHNALGELKNLGKKVYITSDMYLEKKHLLKICQHFEIDRYISDIFVSSEFKLGKHSGRLFDKLIEKNNINPIDLLHIGDNRRSDFYAARNKKIEAFYYFDKNKEAHYLKIFRKVQQINLKELDNIYIQKISPAVSYFIYHVLLDCISLKLKKVYFCAREGVFLKAVADQMLKQVKLFSSITHEVQTEILYFSRTSDVSANLTKIQTDYFTQKGIFSNDNVAVVDMDGADTMQHAIANSALSLGYSGQYYGFYFGVFSSSICNNPPKNFHVLPGYLISALERKDIIKIKKAAHVLEFIFGNDMIGSTITYEKQGNIVLPVFEEINVSAAQISQQKRIQDNIIRGINEMVSLLNSAIFDFSLLRQQVKNRLFDFLIHHSKNIRVNND